MGPVAWVDRHDVGVADEREALGVPVAAGQPGDQVGPVGLARDELALDPGLAEVVGQVPRDERLVAGCVAGVEADEVAREAHDLLVEMRSWRDATGRRWSSSVETLRGRHLVALVDAILA